jgi:hypothetical protein
MVARMRKAQLALAAVVVAATRMIACGSTVSASHYDQTCQTSADCVAIGVGDPCSTPCEEFPQADAISRKALETYNYDAFSAQYSCSHCGAISGCSGNPAAAKSAQCVQGTCALCDGPSCTGTDAGGVPEGGTDAGNDAPAEAAPEAAPPADAPPDVPAQQDGPGQDAPASDSPSGG